MIDEKIGYDKKLLDELVEKSIAKIIEETKADTLRWKVGYVGVAGYKYMFTRWRELYVTIMVVHYPATKRHKDKDGKWISARKEDKRASIRFGNRISHPLDYDLADQLYTWAYAHQHRRLTEELEKRTAEATKREAHEIARVASDLLSDETKKEVCSPIYVPEKHLPWWQRLFS